MQSIKAAALTLILAAPVAAQQSGTDGADTERLQSCTRQAQLVVGAVEARADGVSQRRARRGLRKELGPEAAEMLSAWIYSLPEEQLTPAVGDAWQAQCIAALEQLANE